MKGLILDTNNYLTQILIMVYMMPEMKLVQPYHEDNWYEDLQDASGLDMSPGTGLISPPGAATEESASFDGDEEGG